MLKTEKAVFHFPTIADVPTNAFRQSDPVSDKYSSLSPYNFAFNNPAGHNDPSGADPAAESTEVHHRWGGDWEEMWQGNMPNMQNLNTELAAWASLTSSANPFDQGYFDLAGMGLIK